MTKIVNEETGWGKLQFTENHGMRQLNLSIETITTILRLGYIAKALAKWYGTKGQDLAKKASYLMANQMWAIALLARKQEKNVRYYIYRPAEAEAFTAEESKHASAVVSCGGELLAVPFKVLSTEGLSHIALHRDSVDKKPTQRNRPESEDDETMEATDRALLLAIGRIADTKDHWPVNDIMRCLNQDSRVMSLL